MSAPRGRELDVVVFGATGFVGRLTAQHLAAAAPERARIGLAGRSRERLEQVRAGLGPGAADWPLLVADSADVASLDALAARTQVVVTTVGPYARHGLPLVQACARAGTDYADLTGEVLFVRESADAAHETAQASGARIVHACGFDSIPSDLGVLLTAERAATEGDGELAETRLALVAARGGVSGGTVDSLRVQVDAVRADPARRAVLADPYALSPDRAAEPDLGSERDPAVPAYDADAGGWTAPFVMGPFNSRIVRRSNALTGWSYGRSFRYREVVRTGRSPFAPALATGIAVGTAGAALGMALPGARTVLDRLLPSPGEGPGERTRRTGHFTVQVTARTTTGARWRTTVAMQGDPGYAATAVMLGEAALALALDRDRLPDRAGVLTPASGIGDALAERLRAAGAVLTTERL